MVNLTSASQLFEADTSTLDTTPTIQVGQRAYDANGNEYAYWLGVASTAAGDWASMNAATYQTARLATNAVGPVGIAMAAIVASTYGWYQVYGYNTISASDTVAGAGALYIDGTAGRVDDADVAGDVVIGAYSTAADATNVLPVMIAYPHVSNIAID